MSTGESIRPDVDALWALIPHERREDLAVFIERARTTDLPFLPCAVREPAALYRDCFTVLHALGTHSIPLGVALSMHLYMLCAFATLPLAGEGLRARRREFLDIVGGGRLIIANSGSDSFHRSDNAKQTATRAVRTTDGILVTGQKSFVSLATVADLLIFTAELEGTGVVSLYTSLKDNPCVHTEGSPFGAEMAPSGTRSIIFRGLRLPEDHVVTGGESAGFSHAHEFQRAWFQALIPAVYLGAAEAALAAARDFLQNTRSPAGARLAELDGFVVAFGQQLLELRAVHAVSDALCQPLAACCEPECEPDALQRFVGLAATLKYVAMRQVQHAVDRARICIGTRAMHPDHLLHRLTQQVPYGALHPECEAIVERRVGSAYLGTPPNNMTRARPD